MKSTREEALSQDFGLEFHWRPRKGARWYPDSQGGSVSSALHGDECIATPTTMFREHQELASHYGRFLQSDGMVHIFHTYVEGHWTPKSPDEFRKPQWQAGAHHWHPPLRLGPPESEAETIERLGLQSDIDAYLTRRAIRESERAEMTRSAQARAEHNARRDNAKRRIICVAHMGDVTADFDPKYITRRQRTEARILVGDDDGLKRLVDRAMVEGLDVILEEVAAMKTAKTQRLRDEDARETKRVKTAGSGNLNSSLADALRAALK